MGKTRVTEKVTAEEIKSWKNGDIITIKAGTGAGKSYMVKNHLYSWAKSNNKKILFLIHRKNCVDQFQMEIEEDKKTDVIDIRTYQSIEFIQKSNQEFDFSKYEYIVCDEFRYFMGDASFNKTTDMSLDAILSQTNKIRIFMSATGDYMKNYIEKYKGLTIIPYELDIDFSFIKELAFFNKDETLDFFIEETMKRKEKSIFFIQSVEKAYNIHKKYKKHTIFNCSKYNSKYYKHVDKKKIDNILKNEKFESPILITTECMDAGVNIIDKDVKHIIVDVEDVGSLIQCIGRKRQQDKEDKIYLYIKNIHNKQLGGMITQTQKKIKMAEFFKINTVQEYIKKYNRETNKTDIVYDVTVEETDKSTKKLNELMYFKNKIDIVEYQFMLQYGKYGYCSYLADKFGFIGDKQYTIMEEDFYNKSLEDYLDSIVGEVMLTSDDRKELIERLDVKSNGKQLKSLDSLNSAMRERKINFYIDKFETSRVINGRKKNYKSAWRLLKLVDK